MVSDKDFVQTLDMPLEESKRGVFTAYLNLILSCANVIGVQSSDTDNRPNEIIDMMISILPNVKKQEELRKERDDRIEKQIKNLTTNEEKGRVIKRINREIMGKVSAYMDIYQGGDRKNRISFIIPRPDMRALMVKANPDHFKEHQEKL